MITVFLDRDGVVNRYRRPTVLSWEKFEFLPGVLDTLKRLDRDDVQTFICTNKAWIGLRILSRKRHEAIHARMLEEIRDAGGRIDAIYTCPHTPIAGCSCRKPRPGMLERAARQHEVDRDHAWMVGDHVSDHQTGRAFGTRTILLRTTHDDIEDRAAKAGESPDFFADGLPEAVDIIFEAEGLDGKV